jgi:hypothetical protein
VVRTRFLEWVEMQDVSCHLGLLALLLEAFWGSKSGSMMKRVRFDAFDDPKSRLGS